jgi:hypothetical protein
VAKTPTKKDILTKINELIAAVNALAAQLDEDTGVSKTNYEAIATVETFNDEQLGSLDQLANQRE